MQHHHLSHNTPVRLPEKVGDPSGVVGREPVVSTHPVYHVQRVLMLVMSAQYAHNPCQTQQLQACGVVPC